MVKLLKHEILSVIKTELDQFPENTELKVKIYRVKDGYNYYELKITEE